MEKDILSKVIEVEGDIHKRISLEKERADELIENARKEAEGEVIREEARLKAGLEMAIKEAKSDAEKSASEMISEADLVSLGLMNISDAELKEIIMRHIRKILPLPE